MANEKKLRVEAAIKGSVVLEFVNAIRGRIGAERYERLVRTLHDEDRKLFLGVIDPGGWYSLDACVHILEADLQANDGGIESVLVERSEAVFDKQLRGIYRLFVKFGSPEFLMKRIGLVHMTYFNGILLESVSQAPGRAVFRYTGFEPKHHLIGCAIVGFYKKALEMSGATGVRVVFATPIREGKGYAELVASWA